MSVLTAVLLARWLGPTDYGRYTFLIASFMAIRGLLDLGMPSAFFTLLSRRRRSKTFIYVFWKFIAFQFSLILILLLVLLPDSITDMIWPGESRTFIILGFISTFIQGTVWASAAQMAEASRQTAGVQKLGVYVTLIHLLVVVLLFTANRLGILFLFISIIFEWGVAALLVSKLYNIDPNDKFDYQKKPETAYSILKDFYSYCLPLLPMVIIDALFGLADRWMLQKWGGAEQQAFFGVALQLSGVVLITTSSILNIMWKEIAEAYEVKNIARVEVLYHRSCRVLYFFGAFLAGALQPLVPFIVDRALGSIYLGSAITLSIMLLYPVHQSLGQINGMTMLASGKTKEYSLVSSFSMLLSFVALYVMLAPSSMPIPGFHLGSHGLALKQVGMQLLSVNLLGWMIARALGWKFDWLYQVQTLGACLTIGWISYFLIFKIILEDNSLLAKLICMQSLYFFLILITLFRIPSLVGLSREALKFNACRAINLLIVILTPKEKSAK